MNTNPLSDIVLICEEIKSIKTRNPFKKAQINIQLNALKKSLLYIKDSSHIPIPLIIDFGKVYLYTIEDMKDAFPNVSLEVLSAPIDSYSCYVYKIKEYNKRIQESPEYEYEIIIDESNMSAKVICNHNIEDSKTNSMIKTRTFSDTVEYTTIIETKDRAEIALRNFIYDYFIRYIDNKK